MHVRHSFTTQVVLTYNIVLLQDFARRRFFKDHHGAIKRRREIQRTIDRLQPGKSKGNLLSNLASNKNEDSVNPVGPIGTKLKDTKVEKNEKEEETLPKLSLGTVLNRDVIGFGHHSFEQEESVIVKHYDSQDDSNDEKPLLMDEEEKTSQEDEEKSQDDDVIPAKKAKEEVSSPTVNMFEKKNIPSQTAAKPKESSTPNLSAWFKAFGQPKSQPTVKKKVEQEKEEVKETKIDQPKAVPKETEEIISIDDEKDKKVCVAPPLISPARRQRKASTGSSVSERSSFSQDPTDPLADGSSPRPSLDEPYLSPQADPSKTPYHHSPVNGTIRVGFYQDTSFPRGSSDKSSSPREPPTPNCSPREPPSCSPRDLPSCSPRDLPSVSPREPMPSPKSDYPIYSGGALPYQSPSVNNYEAPLSPYPAHMSYYDTSKPLTEQYKPPQTVQEKPAPSTYPVKKRICNEFESPARSSPDVNPSPAYRGGSFTPTRNAIENDRSFTPTPGRLPTPATTRHTYTSESALALGLHGIPSHLMDPFAEERLLSAGYFSGGSIYDKNTAQTTLSHPIFPPASGSITTAGYTDRGYTRLTSNYSEPRGTKSSENTSPYPSTLAPTTQPPVINYSARSSEMSPSNTGPSSPLNYSNASSSNMASLTSSASTVNYSNRLQNPGKMLESPLDFAKISQNEALQSKDTLATSYATSKQMAETLPPKVSSPFNRSMSELAKSGLNYNRSPDLISGKLNVPASPLNYPTQQELFGGKVNYSHPISELARFNYSHGVGYNHPMSDLMQAKATSGSYTNNPMDLMNQAYNRPISELLPGRDITYQHQQVSRPSVTPKHPEAAPAKPVVPKKTSKKRKSSDAPAGVPPGFQQYLGQPSSEAIALKTSSVVPGSAFNFGPAPLKNTYTSYLEDIRPPGYFAPHTESSASTKSSSPQPHPHPPSSPFQYLSHAPTRPLGYPHPFMNPSYQQYIQKHPEELLRPMMLHQGLLPPTGYPPGYLNMHDAINRSSWL